MHYQIRTVARGAAFLFGALALGACERELPTAVGGEQVPESSLRTYEVLLQDEVFLAGDTLLRGFGTTPLSTVLIVAEDYRGILDAHGLVQFGNFPITVAYADSSGTQSDTVMVFRSGRIVMRVDSLSIKPDSLVAPQDSIRFEIYTLAESFEARTTTWTARSVAGGDTTYWTTPGGTTAELIGSQMWVRGDSIRGDSLVFAVDSTIVNAWAAAEEDARSILIRTTTAGARAHVAVTLLSLNARLENDTAASRPTSAVVQEQAYVYDPAPPAPLNELRVGDRSAWRSFLTFASGLDTLEIPCPGEPGCTFRLGDVTVNRAELRLTGLAVPEIFRPRANIVLEARPVLGAESLPLARAPLGDTTGVAFGTEPATFAADGDSLVRIGVTRFVRGLLDAGADSLVSDRNRTVALLTSPEPISFGIGRFGGFGSAHAPVLRLIVTLPPREEDE